MPTDFAPHQSSTDWGNPSRYYTTASSIVNSSFPAYHAFDGNSSSRWISGGACPQWLMVAVGTKQLLESYAITVSTETGRAPTAWTLEGSNDGATWTTLDSQSGVTSWADPETKSFTVTGNTTKYWMYRLNITASNGSNPAITELYLYTTTLNTVDDVAPHNMTGMSAPSPYVVTESGHVSSFAGYLAFNDPGGSTFDSWVSSPPSWIALDLGSGNAKAIRGYIVWNVNATDSPTAWTLAGSNDGVSYTTLDSQSSVTWDNNGVTDGIANVYALAADTAAYRYYKLTITAAAGSNAWLRELHLIPAAISVAGGGGTGGGDGGDTVRGSVRVTLDGLDRTEFLHYQGSTSFNLMRGNRGTCTLPFIVPPGSTFMPVIGQYVEIEDNGQREWAGTIETVDIGWYGDDGWHVSTATGVTLDSLIDGVQLDKEQIASLEGANLSCGDAFTTLFTAADLPRLTLGTVEDGPNIQALNVTSLKDGFDSLAKFAGKVWYVDSRDLKVYFHDAGLRAADWVLTDQPTSAEGGILWDSIRWSQSRTDFADTQVIQLPMQTIAAQSATFTGDGSTTLFTFPDGKYPQYVVSAAGSSDATTSLGHSINWIPGSNQVTITPAMAVGQSMVVKWLDTSQVIVTDQDFGNFVGHKARRYVRTRTFTEDGTEQEATAMLARYAMLPSQAVLTTDKPGITIARKWQIDIDSPAEAPGLLNGYWQVVEVEAVVVPGMDQLGDPYGHFRYTLHLVNFYATAIYEGDGETTSFALPQDGSAAQVTVYNAPGSFAGSIALPNYVSVTPAPPPGATVVTQYTPSAPNSSAPDVQPFTDAWQQMFPDSGLEPIPLTGQETGGEVPVGELHIGLRTLTLRDLTVRDDCAPHTLAYHAGVGERVIAVLRKSIASDLNVTIHIGSFYDFDVVIPSGTSVDEQLSWPLTQGSPPADLPIEDLDVLTADITASDGSKDVDGVAQITVLWNWRV